MAAPTKDDVKAMTQMEISGLNDLHSRMVEECYRKCVHTARSAELEVGEMSCIDRCVPKYFQVHEMVQGEFAKFNAMSNPAAAAPAGQ